jgi:hypothetical protein
MVKRTHLGGERLDGLARAGRRRAARSADPVDDVILLRRLAQRR